MESSSQPDQMHKCATCGAWIRIDHPRCPWCGAGSPAEADDDEAPAGESDTLTMMTPVSSDNTVGVDEERGAGAAMHESESPTRIYETVEAPAVSGDTPGIEAESPLRSGEGMASILFPREGRCRPFWIRAFSLAALFVLFMLVTFSALGVYRGLNDRRVRSKSDAIAYFEQGNALVEEGNYELALANYREAYRLEPNFEAAAYMIDMLERYQSGASRPTAGAPVVTATMTSPGATSGLPTSSASDAERLFNEAQASLARDEWEMAAATLDILSSQAPNFRTSEVATALFTARLEAGKAALLEEALDDAIRHFDHALAVRPDDAEAQRLRRLTSAYRAGLRAMERKDWGTAADQFRVVYLVDDAFLETRSLLAQAHIELAEAYAEREIWCEAAQQYRSSAAVSGDEAISALASQANNRCVVRVAATSVPEQEVADSEEGEEEDEEIASVNTPTPEPEIEATEATSATATAETGGVGGAAESPTPVATPTLAPTLPPAPTAPPAGPAFQAVGGVSLLPECPGNYVRGTVRAADGAPLAGITVVAMDDFGNRLTGTSKVDPLGQYDIPISGSVPGYRVQVIGNGQALSPEVTIRRDESTPQNACFVINWQQIQ